MKVFNIDSLEKIANLKFFGISTLILLTPLLVVTNGYFPFVLYKTILVELLAVAGGLIYIYLLISNWQKYKPSFNWLWLGVGLWLVWMTLTSFINNKLAWSWWGDWRQAEGLFLLFSLFVWFLAVQNILSKKQWMWLIKISLGVSVVVSILAFIQAKGTDIVFLPTVERIGSTLGNAAYLATYCLWNAGLAFYLFINSVNKNKYYYLLVGLINVVAVILSGTRGAILGLVSGLVVGVLFYLFNDIKKEKKVIKKIVVLTAVGFVFIGLFTSVFIFRDNLPDSYKSKLVALSSSTTIQTRLSIWCSSWQSVLEKPIFGYGYENFSSAFDQKAEIKYYQLASTEPWVSRAHNVFVDNLVYGGFVGLLLYLFIWLGVAWQIFQLNDVGVKAKIILFSLLITILIQSLFIFDSIATYVMMFLFFGFVSASKKENFGKINTKLRLLFVLVALAVFMTLSYYQWQVWQSGVNLLTAVNWINKGDASLANEYYQKINSYKQSHDYNVVIIDNLSKVVAQKEVSFFNKNDLIVFLNNVINNFETKYQNNRKTEDYFFYQRGLLMLLEVEESKEIKEKLTNSLIAARNQFPNNQQFLWLQITLNIQLDQLVEAEKYVDEAIKAFPDNYLGYWYKSLIEFSKKDDSELGFTNGLMAIEKGYVPPLDENWQRLYNYYYNKQNWLTVEKLLRVYVKQEPDDRDGYINLSDIVARQGRKDEAKKILMDLIKNDKGATDDVYVQIQKINQMK